MRNWIVAAGLGGMMIVATALEAGDEKAKETPDDSTPTVVVVRIAKTGHADSEKVGKSVGQPLRDSYAAKDVLFLEVDVTSRESRHQAKLLLNSLELGTIWAKHGQKPGSIVVFDVMEGEIALVADAKTAADKAKKSVETILNRDREEEEAPEEEGDGDESMD